MSRNSNPWTDEEIQFVKDNYETMTQREIAEKINRTESAVNIKASKLGLKKGYQFNRRYFQNIDSADKAYWLGFIWADGCITKVDATNSGELSIELQVTDIMHLKKFNKCLDGNLQVKTRIRSNCFKGQYADREYETAFIRVHSIDMVNDLEALGCSSAKSSIIGMPKISDEFMWDFIRGYFDGDGCVRYADPRYPNEIRCDFTSVAEDLTNNLRAWLYENNVLTHIFHDRNKLRLTTSGTENAIKLLSNMYDNATIYLDRKYQKQIKIRNK